MIREVSVSAETLVESSSAFAAVLNAVMNTTAIRIWVDLIKAKKNMGKDTRPNGTISVKLSQKKPQSCDWGQNWRRHTLPLGIAVPSALIGLTSLFGMGRGGPYRYSHHKV